MARPRRVPRFLPLPLCPSGRIFCVVLAMSEEDFRMLVSVVMICLAVSTFFCALGVMGILSEMQTISHLLVHP